MNDDVANTEFQNGELDRAIRTALVVDADPRGVERVEQYWRVQSRKDRWQRRGYFAMTAAAAALVLIGLLSVAKDRDEGAKTASGEPAPVEGAVAAAEPSPGPARRSSPQASLKGRGDEVPLYLAGRTPTEYERFMFIARTGKRTPAMAESKVDGALSRERRGVNPEEMLAEIEQTGGVEGLMGAAKRTREPQLQTAAISRLLEIGSDEALLRFLSLVRDGSTQASALVVADSASQLPLDAFLAFLDHDDKVVRRSAALLLGHVNGPEVTQALIARLSEQPAGATEAWIALMNCRGETAAEFIFYAAGRPQLLGHLNNARVQWAYRIP